jgi:hypothetical protein
MVVITFESARFMKGIDDQNVLKPPVAHQIQAALAYSTRETSGGR